MFSSFHQFEKKKKYIKHHLMSELSILHLLACISASQKGILSSSSSLHVCMCVCVSACVCVVGGCAEVTALRVQLTKKTKKN